ncbi:RNA polymerase sigma factor [Thermogemmatispora onikobensis]|uniref:RNA polymerase sigma factor n=1 Tax=Thermogemmatispora onikobensis TaxID=732234 RepID=UPI0008533AB6|nr:RNA polymerase sigma factor [Thermogemmatispora onikobensis]
MEQDDLSQGIETELVSLRPALERFFRRQLHDSSAIDDCVDETYARAYQSLRQRALPLYHPRAWLFKIARRVLAQYRAEEQKRRRTGQIQYYATTDGELRSEIDDLADDAEQQPEALVERRDQARLLALSLEALPRYEQTAVMLHFSGQSAREISAQTGRPRRTVNDDIRRGISRLRRLVHNLD